MQGGEIGGRVCREGRQGGGGQGDEKGYGGGGVEGHSTGPSTASCYGTQNAVDGEGEEKQRGLGRGVA